MIKKLFVISISILSYSQIFSQNTYYVAPSTSGGDNSNSGALSAPFETLAHAIEQLSAGDILYVREGVYRETITIDEDGNWVDYYLPTTSPKSKKITRWINS